MPAATHEDDLIRLAAAVKSREQFEAIFDQVRAIGTSLPFKVLALLDAQRPYLKSYHHAREFGFLDTLLGHLMHAQVLNLELLAAPGTGPLSVTAQLQAVTRPDLGFMNMAVEINGKMIAARRLCCITVLKADLATPQAAGTGFLVGPQIVLTSGHLLNDLLDDAGQPVAQSAKRIRVAFDQFNGLSVGIVVPVQEKWLVDRRGLHPLEAQRQVLNWDDPPEAGFDEHLDFALVRLSRAVGYERGFYALDARRMPVVDPVGGMVALLQHPAGFPQSSAPGAALRLWPPTFKSRMLHNANSAEGSSGGLLVDSEFQPIGLHQCTYTDAQSNPVCNGAIPTARIAGLKLPLSQVLGLDPVWKIKETDEPVIGREDFQYSVLEALEGKTRILTVAGTSRMGRGFTTRILREMLGIAEHQLVDMSASSIPVSARETALAILSEIGGAAAGAVLPTASDADSAQPAWIAQELLPAFKRAVATAALQRIIWLVIDDVDRHPIANTSTRVFLESVYSGMTGIPGLRIVLIGFQGAVPGALPGQVRGEILREFSVPELMQYIDRESTARQIQRLPAQSRSLAEQLLQDVPIAENGSRQAELARRAAVVAGRP